MVCYYPQGTPLCVEPWAGEYNAVGVGEETDRQIDQLVFELYGLTDEEIKMVEREELEK